jgi:hypothetical protein
MRVIFNKPSRGSAYGVALPGQELDLSEELARHLMAQGIARHALPPAVEYEVIERHKVEYETKVILPAEAPEVSAREPFRNVPVSDAKPETLDSEGNRVLSTANIFEPAGTPDPVRRRRRSGSDSE